MGSEAAGRVVREFVAALDRAWVESGVTYDDLEAWSRRAQAAQGPGGPITTMPRSTTQANLVGARSRLPRRDFVTSLITSLRGILAERGRDPGRVGSVEEWQARHVAAEAELRELQRAEARLVAEVKRAFGRVMNGQASRAGGSSTAQGFGVVSPATERVRRAALLSAAKRAAPSAWWHDFEDVVPGWFATYLTLERSAARLRIYEPGGIPDLLETEEAAWARARLSRPDAGPEELGRMVEVQMARQEWFRGDDAGELWVWLDESVLDEWADRSAQRAQIAHILALCEMRRISVQVRSGDADTGVGSPVRLLRFSEAVLPDVVYLEEPSGALYPERPDSIHEYSSLVFGQFVSAASPAASVEILHGILKRLQ